MAGSSLAVDINKVRDGVNEAQADNVAVEEPLEIRLGYSTPEGRASRSVSITMRTPGNDEELAAGFLYTEAIIHRAADIASIAMARRNKRNGLNGCAGGGDKSIPWRSASQRMWR